jgi:molecular chaperone HtpG
MGQAAEKHATTNQETIAFNAEISRVLHLMIHALYTNRDIFIRELISNASDACDKLRYQAQQDDHLVKDGSELAIQLSFDETAKTLTIADSGIGMNRDDLIEHLGTIAKSGTAEFMEKLSGDATKDANLIGQFGVGFYSAFMVADAVTVRTRKAGESQGWEWHSDGQGSFTVTEAEGDVARGTAITLQLKEDAKGYLDKHKIEHIVKTYSDHIAFPISLAEEGGESLTLNDGTAIWARAKSDITDAQYQEFYRHVAHTPDTPWLTLHNKVEGALEYTNLLFVPGMKPFDLFHPDRRTRVKLYVKRVFITDEGVELVPAYLRFLRGVIDSSDLPLNISRETLQKNSMLDKIRDSVTSRVLGELKKKASKDLQDYRSFWGHFGPVIKEGLCEAVAPRDKLLDACLFATTHEAEGTTLAAYKERMKEGQEAIYYVIGDRPDALANSPQIEGFKKRGIEVLLLSDHVDDFWTNVTQKYGDIPFRDVQIAGEDLKTFPLHDSEESAQHDAAPEDEVNTLIAAMKTLFGEEVADVRTTEKLSESPVCLAVAEGAMHARMERFLMEHNQLNRAMPKILELNPRHPLIAKLASEAQSADAIADRAWLLLDQARIAEGEPVSDLAAFARRLNAQMMG